MRCNSIRSIRFDTLPVRHGRILTVRLVDQAEMLGLLNRLHNMGLTLLSIELWTSDPT